MEQVYIGGGIWLEMGGGIYVRTTEGQYLQDTNDRFIMTHSQVLMNEANEAGGIYMFIEIPYEPGMKIENVVDIEDIGKCHIVSIYNSTFERNRGESGSALKIEKGTIQVCPLTKESSQIFYPKKK